MTVEVEMRPRTWLIIAALVGLLAVVPAARPAVGHDVTATPFPKDGLLVFAGACEGCRGYGGESGLFTLRSDGKKQGYVANGVGASEPRWSPNGRWIAVAKTQIVLLAAVGSGMRIVTAPPAPGLGADDTSPSWFPNGTRLVFTRNPVNSPVTGEGPPVSIWSVGIDGGRGSQLLASTPPAGALFPEISPNGRRLAFSDSENRLWVAKADGSGRRRLGPATIRGSQPRWSPDGRRVAYLDPPAERLRILDLATNRTRTVPLDRPRGSYAWSSDGKWLAVGRSVEYTCDDPEGCFDFQLWVVSSFDGRMTRILRAPGGELNGLDWRH